MKCMIMAGGTGGHVFPALAVAQALRERGHDVVWMGAPDSFESRVVPQHGIPMEYVRVTGLRGKGLLKLLYAPLLVARAVLQALAVMRRQQPDVALGMGGFASGPGGVAAWLQRRPLFIHEQNAVAGFTNRCLARLAHRVLEAFPGAFPAGQASTVGNPVRQALAQLPPPEQRMAGRQGRLKVLVVGGSQGARVLNQTVPAALALMSASQRPEVRHQAGRTLDIAQEAYARHAVTAQLEAFIEDMAAAYNWADVVVCRSGASTVSELAAAGCAAVLVPFAAAVDDHQTRNGEYLVKPGAAVLIAEAELSPQRLAKELADLQADRDRVLRMAQVARTLAMPQAVGSIVTMLEGAVT